MRKQKVIVAMSGGVDSSVAAGLLLEQGYDVQAVSLRMWEAHQGPRVCSDHRGAEEVAALLGIEHTLLDFRSRFFETVVKPFAKDYLGGRTPNPCVACNRDFKLGALLDWAKEQRVDYVATGHYARIVRASSTGSCALFRGVDAAKDQSYFLFALSRAQLKHTLFPLAELHKKEVREHARRFRLPIADRPESQDICFGDYKTLVESLATGDDLGSGDIVDRSGNVLGRHNGIHRFTIGQRKGLGISAPEALHVVAIETPSKRVVVGERNKLGCRGLVAQAVNWLEPPGESEIEAGIQVRYRAQAVPGNIRQIGNGGCEVRFNEIVPAVTPGQAAVFYRGTQILGGGWIEKAIKN